ncbi:MAG: arginine deiminase [Acidobacteria bacterium]|nr:arginine deiminase [Acidobacteriota bacterium]
METAIAQSTWNGHSMVGVLKRVLVCSPADAGWGKRDCAARWQELGFRHAIQGDLASAQHDAMCRELQGMGAEVLTLPPSPELSLDAVYAHDASLPTDFGSIVLRPGKANRVGEAVQQQQLYEQLGMPIFGHILPPATAEAGDMVWVDSKTLLIGHGYRTNSTGIHQIHELLAPKGIQVIAAPLPYGAGPSACLHLMSLISLLDETTALADLAWLAVETVEFLRSRAYSLIEIDSAERETLAVNVLSLGRGRLLALEENKRTNERLRRAGFDVRTFPGTELSINGGGGPTCLTRPLLRL